MSILIDDALAFDAGGLTSTLSFQQQAALRALFLTHQHYDHVRDIPTLGMSFLLLQRRLTLYGLAVTRDAVIPRLLDGALYPDFLHQPNGEPTFTFETVTPGVGLAFDGYTVTPYRVPHSVPAAGYLVTAPGGASLFYAGDSGPGLAAVWREIRPDLLIIETTASDRYAHIGAEGRHLTPSLLGTELASFRDIQGYLPCVVTVHMSPVIEGEIVAELAAVAASLGAEIQPAHEGLRLTI